LGASILKPNPGFHQVIKAIPLSSLFLETDESPLQIEIIYMELSKILGIPIDQLKYQIYDNYIHLFPIKT
jgi:Tat protein secretion system quality control protein TatD with DNase activity